MKNGNFPASHVSFSRVPKKGTFKHPGRVVRFGGKLLQLLIHQIATLQGEANLATELRGKSSRVENTKKAWGQNLQKTIFVTFKWYLIYSVYI